jgi:predicted small secreted protein
MKLLIIISVLLLASCSDTIKNGWGNFARDFNEQYEQEKQRQYDENYYANQAMLISSCNNKEGFGWDYEIDKCSKFAPRTVININNNL